MPLSEFLRMARGKLESSHQKPGPAEILSRSENELVELVWENGQVVMQGQSSRVARSPTLNNLPSNTNRVRDPGVGHGATPARYGKFGVVELIVNDMASVVPSGDMDLSQDDEIGPWLSYPIDDAMGQDYVSEILPQISGVTANGLSTQNSFVSVDKRSSCEQTGSNLQSGVKVSPSSKDRPFASWLPQHRQTLDGLGSGVTDIVSNNSMDAVFRNPAQSRDTVDGSASMVMERQNIPTPTNNSNFLNFSHFSRSATLAKANLPNSDGIPKSVSSVAERLENKEKGSAANCGNPVKLMNIERLNSIPKEIESRGSGTLPKVNSREPVVKTPQDPERTKNLFQETSIKNDKPLILSNKDGAAKGAPEGERIIEPMVASSSVGSGNSADRVSCEQTQHSKRKFHDMEDSECRSDDLETESVDAKKGTGVRGSKRSRAAEVHNLSERRRRDRINEKMRALQELIPNCNKADKASMLDEAIEYLKTLQLQVQIMSMGSGLCMPPMMFPAGMQHMHPAHVQHFQPMGVGMGMGMAFGMGMPDMNGGSSSCPIYPVPPLQVPAFPSPMSGLANFQRMPGQNHPVFGHPGQAFPNSAPRPPFVPLAPRPPVTSAMGSSALRNGSTCEIPSTSQVMNSGDPATIMKSQPMLNAEATNPVNNKSNQLQPTNEVQEKSIGVQDKKQANDAGGSAARSSANATDINKEPGCD